MSRRVLVPIDFSEASAEAARRGAREAGTAGVLRLLHVLEAPVTMPVDHMPVGARAEGDEAELAAQRKAVLEQWVEELGLELEASRIVVELGAGAPADEIVVAAGSADLVVMPTHGRSGLRRWLLGSVAERVVRASPCDVLIVR